MRRQFRALFAGLFLTANAAASEDLLLINEVKGEHANIYQEESRYYLDRASIKPGIAEAVTFYTARTITDRPGHPRSIDEIAVTCAHPTLGFALSIRRLGVMSGKSIINSVDLGPVTSMSDFNLTQLTEGPGNMFANVTYAICRMVEPAAVPSNKRL